MKLISLENLQLYDEELKKYLSKEIMDAFNDCEAIVQKDSYISFPLVGNEKTLYLDTFTSMAYRWSDEDAKYYRVGSDWNDITTINGNF